MALAFDGRIVNIVVYATAEDSAVTDEIHIGSIMADNTITVDTDHLYAGGYVGAQGAHVTFYDKIGDTPVRVNLDSDQTIELIKLLASTLKVA